MKQRGTACALVVGALLLGGCQGSYVRKVADSRISSRALIESVSKDGIFELADGRKVRLFGVRLPVERGSRARWHHRLQRHVGKEATFHLALHDDVPAGELLVWERRDHGSHALSSWVANPAPRASHWGRPLARSLVVAQASLLSEADLSHPDADPHQVRTLRMAQDHGLRWHAGLTP